MPLTVIGLLMYRIFIYCTGNNLTDGTQSLICSNSPGHVGPPGDSGGKQAQTVLLL